MKSSTWDNGSVIKKADLECENKNGSNPSRNISQHRHAVTNGAKALSTTATGMKDVLKM
jgi:hypothetical protein